VDSHAASCNLASRCLRSFWYWDRAAVLSAAALAALDFFVDVFFFLTFFFLVVVALEAAEVVGFIGDGVGSVEADVAMVGG